VKIQSISGCDHDSQGCSMVLLHLFKKKIFFLHKTVTINVEKMLSNRITGGFIGFCNQMAND